MTLRSKVSIAVQVLLKKVFEKTSKLFESQLNEYFKQIVP